MIFKFRSASFHRQAPHESERKPSRMAVLTALSFKSLFDKLKIIFDPDNC